MSHVTTGQPSSSATQDALNQALHFPYSPGSPMSGTTHVPSLLKHIHTLTTVTPFASPPPKRTFASRTTFMYSPRDYESGEECDEAEAVSNMRQTDGQSSAGQGLFGYAWSLVDSIKGEIKQVQSCAWMLTEG